MIQWWYMVENLSYKSYLNAPATTTETKTGHLNQCYATEPSAMLEMFDICIATSYM